VETKRYEHNPFAAAWLWKDCMCLQLPRGYLLFRALKLPCRQARRSGRPVGIIGQLLDTILPGQHPPKPEPKKIDTGYRPIGLNEKPLDWMVF
jgi:hypothetical protein